MDGRLSKRPETRSKLARLFFIMVILPAFLYSLAELAGGADQQTESGQQAKSAPPAEFIQPIEFSHKTHIEKGGVPCEFCHVYARRSINSGAPAMASCFGCHSVVAGSDEDQKEAIRKQEAIKKLLEYKANGESVPWKKIHDLPDFVHFSHKRHIQVGFDCTECHGEIDQHDVLSIQTMITDLSMGWCMKCHTEGRQTVNGKIAGPVQKTRGGKIMKQAAAQQPDGILLGSKDCYTCHK
ncbi:MAG: hypothetical protein DRI57_06315 [Deltaproteobacteria bacterium]|nr:MAG: hypothetical protein DRI57_06315 [Deltaproteobacteria bacterium]